MLDRPLATRAPAKINLSLHVLGRRADGHHDIESLVAFAGVGDTLTLTPGESVALEIEGPTAAAAGLPAHNLVLRTARNLLELRPGLRAGAFRLTKRLPVAAGIGGGSADAAAALRLLARHNGISLEDPAVLETARATGADVPVCLAARARVMGGIGERLGPPLRLPRLFAVLVNPGVSVETAKVFAALALSPGERLARDAHPSVAPDLAADELLRLLAQTRNDLEAPARTLAPVIGEALALIGQTPGCGVVRMSGSGATVFGLFRDCTASAAAARSIRRARPGWWVKGTSMR